MRLIELTICGLRSPRELRRLRRAIKRIPVVGMVNICLDTGHANIEIDPIQLSPRRLIEVIQAMGYEVYERSHLTGELVMQNARLVSPWCTLTLCLLFVASEALVAAAQNPAGETPVSFSKEVAPILVSRCLGCHGQERPKGGYRLDSYVELMKESQGEARVVAGKPEDSHFWEVLQPDGDPRMPYKEDRLSKEQLAVIERWIRQGAKFDGPEPRLSLLKIMPRPPENRTPPQTYGVPVPVTALAFSPDGTQIASAGYHELLIWETATGKLLKRLQGLPAQTLAIRYSSNGNWIATAGGTPGSSGLVRLWDARTGQAIRDLLETEDSMFALAFSPDSKLLAAGGVDRTIHIFDLATGKLAKKIEDHADWVLDLDFSPDGTRLVSAARDKTAKVFDVAKGESLGTFSEHTEPVYAVAFARDGNSVATAGGDKVVRVWTPAGDIKKIRDIPGHSLPVFKLAFTPDGSQLISCSADKTVRQWKAADGAAVRTLSGHADWVYAVAASSDGKLLATASWDGEVRIWNVGDGTLVKNLPAMPSTENIATAQVIASPPVQTDPATRNQ